ncbi:DNA polymerase III subunit gamma/tau [Pseudobacter ginsenosidimutans]|uniref:DNA polymerase III subunit gamma/tau n=1 Tax=Pseudobacter ginsenosidimutans TaxID=661488 RepID=A0A4Q7MV21_9BACT|nr:DNA polymerase III subunit gamma/tau [Pseudobacter ginsenosidimutans]QEC42237.1 DNA polymerase III subunit gamma/tau [Pseudobacter ginsenosidimutans]RZS70920.1 DNA polymerase-3 subunit gamma/tau [Pseudobacter ginsenosidimutans]
MEKFIVSARKYRPQTFDTVVGQGHITTTLKNAIRNQQLAHAFLFCGPRGVGKTTCARILAKTINCEKPGEDGEACNVCHSCVSFNEGTSLNIHELDAASNNSVDDIRTLVEQVRFAPQAGTYKVYIIDEVHMLSSSAFNAFLKTLEEPPGYAIFILATTEKHKILPTILSRCQIFDFKRITTNDTVDHLEQICTKEEVNADRAALHLIAQKSEGCMRDALSIMDKIVSFTNGTVSYQNTLEHLNILDADYYFRFMESMLAQDLGGAMLLYDDIDRKGFEGDLVLNGFAEFVRNLLVCKDQKVANLLQVVESFKDRYIAMGKQVSVAWLINALNILNEAEIGFKAARNKRLHIELVLIKLSYLQQAIELGAGADDGKKKLVDTAKPVAFRQIPVLGAAPKQAAAKPKAEAPQTGAKLIIEDQPAARPASQAVVPPVQPVKQEQPVSDQPKVKIGGLASIRQQFVGKGLASAGEVIPLEEARLHAAWEAFTQQLRDTKNPASQSFVMARLQINNSAHFTIVTNNNLEQKFIEGERRPLSEYLCKVFNNRALLFVIEVDENVVYQEPTDKPMSSRDKFIAIAEEYPLIRELKDRLRLELDL